MKMPPDDPRLSAWLLGELPDEEAQWVERAVAEDPELADEVRRMKELHAILDLALAEPPPGLLPDQVDEIRAAGRSEKSAPKVVPMPVKQRSWAWLISTAAAAVVCGGMLIVAKYQGLQTPVNQTAKVQDVTSSADQMEYLPFPGPSERNMRDGSQVSVNRVPADKATRLRDMQTAALRARPEEFLRRMQQSVQSSPLPDRASLPPLERRGFVDAGFAPGFDIPVLAGRVSFRWVAGYVHDRGELPPAPLVRLEELVNAAAPGISGSSKTTRGVTVSVETLTCKWKPSALIAAIGIHGAADGARDIEAHIQFNKGSISKYRLLGFDPVRGADGGAIPTTLPMRESTVVLVEMQPVGKPSSFGRIGMAVGNGDKTIASLELPQVDEGGPSAGASIAMLMAGFSEWLAGTEGAPDPGMLGAMLREAHAKNPNAIGPQAEAMSLVEDTLTVARVRP